MSLTDQMIELAKQAKSASRDLARLATADKNACLVAMADALEQNTAALKQANTLDMETAAGMGLTSAMLERLKLDEKRISQMAKGLREVAALPDPVGRILDERVRPNGLKLQKITTPIGVIVIIYESRPNVTADAAALCLKSGNATILRGGKEALNSNQTIARIMVEARRGGTDPRGRGMLQGSGDQTLQRRLPCLCGCRRRFENGRGNCDERKSPTAGRLQCHGNLARGQSDRSSIPATHCRKTGAEKSRAPCRRNGAKPVELSTLNSQLSTPAHTRHRPGFLHRIQRLHFEFARRRGRQASDRPH